MPALLPPSMQIGANPPGYSAMPSTGPIRTPMANPALPVTIQSAGFSTSVSGPTNISQTVTATKTGTYLVWGVAVNASAGAALGGTPAGWTLLTSQTVATLAAALYIFPGNPGALTSVTFSSNATATTGGIASWFWELDNVFFVTAKGVSANGNSTSPASGSVTPANNLNMMLGMVAWVLGAATLSAPTGGWTTTNAQTSSTVGTTNAAIETFSQIGAFGPPGAASLGATLSAGSVWVDGVLVVPSTASGNFSLDPAMAAVNARIDGGAGYASGGAWGPLGGTKPGGAGGGY
jgi:hypothetical protein